MSKAYVFPGQGAQFSGMAKELYENHSKAKELIDQSNDILGYDIKAIMYAEKAERFFNNLIERNDVSIDLYLSSTLSNWLAVDNERFFAPMMMVFNRHKKNPIFEEAIISGLDGVEEEFANGLNSMPSFN